MSDIGDALSGGGSSASGISDSTLSDASLGDQLTGGTGDFGTGVGASAFGDAGGGGNSFSSFNDIANAFSGGSAGVGGTPTAVQSASMTPPAAAGQTGGDPTGAAGGTQSNTTPGSTPDQNQQQQSGGGKQQDPNYAPPAAVSQLKALLKQLNSGKPPGPTGPVPTGGQAAPFALPTVAAGETGAQSPGAGGLAALLGGATPAAASLPPLSSTGAPSAGPGPGFPGSEPGGARDITPGAGEGIPFNPKTGDYTLPPGAVTLDAQGNPVTAAGTPAADTPLPPARPGAQPTQTAAGGDGRDITVQPKGAQPTADLPTRVPPGSAGPPTKKPGASPSPAPAPAAQGPATSSIMRDISGVSTGSPTALADLAQAARIILPLVGMLMGGGGRRGGRFHGGRFTHGFGGGLSGFRGGMNAMGHLHQGQHPMARGAWPYHHPVHGWHFHGSHPGQGWLPLNPMDAQGMVSGDTGVKNDLDPNAPDPNRPPKETGDGDQPSVLHGEFEQSGYGSNPFVGALVGQESGGQNIVSKTDKDSQGRTLAQGGNPNEISQGYFQIQNHPGGTWATYARQAGVDLSHYPTPRSAPLDVQWNVASRIPIGQWGHDTKAMLHQRFGQFDERLTLEQVASRSGRAGGRLADAMPQASNIQSQWANNRNINIGPTTLPVASQPMVAGP